MEENATVKGVSMKFGLINGLIGIVLFTILDFAGMAQDNYGQWIGVIILIVLMYYAHQEFKKNGDGYMSYGQGLGIGTLMSLIGSLLSSAYMYLYITFINDQFVKGIREKAIMDMEKKGMSDAEIDQAMKFAEMFMSPVAMVIFGILGGVFFGFIISLIVSAITKKSSPELS